MTRPWRRLLQLGAALGLAGLLSACHYYAPGPHVAYRGHYGYSHGYGHGYGGHGYRHYRPYRYRNHGGYHRRHYGYRHGY